MEHDADSYEIKLCGSSTFKQTTLKLRHLGLAAQGAYASLQQHWSNRRLPDDLNQFIVLHQNRIPPEIWEQAEQAIGSATSGWFDTHPSDKDRIAAAVRLSQPGVYHCSEPAVTLFHNYEEISRKVTQHCYQTNMNLPIASASMIPVAEAIQESSQIEEGNKALNDLAGIDWPFCCPIPLNREDIIGRSSAILDIRLGLAKLRRQIEELKPRAENAVQQLTGAERRYAGVLGAICLLCSGFRFRPESFGLAEASLPRAFEAEKEVKAQQEIGRKELQPLENVLRDRMTLALRALWNPDFASFFAEAVTWQEEVNGLLAALDILNQYHQDLLELRRLYIQMDLLLARLREGNVPESAPSHLYRLCDKIDEILKRLQHGLKDVSYPFVHSEGAISLSVYALNRETSDNAVSRTYQQCSSHVGRLFPLYFRILGRLALLAARVEEQVKD